MHKSHCKNTSNVKDKSSISLIKSSSPIEMFAKEAYVDELMTQNLKEQLQTPSKNSRSLKKAQISQ